MIVICLIALTGLVFKYKTSIDLFSIINIFIIFFIQYKYNNKINDNLSRFIKNIIIKLITIFLINIIISTLIFVVLNFIF